MLIFLKLLLTHLLLDFVFQPGSWIKDREKRKVRSTRVILHAFLHGLFAWLILWDINLWWVGLSIFLTHWLIDVWKSYQKANLSSFLIDQFLHLLVITTITLLLTPSFKNFNPQIFLPQYIVLAIGFLILLRPSSMVVKYFMQGFDLEEPDTYALENAGQWIGYFERLIILLSIIMGAYSVLGFLVAAKSLLRFSDSKKNSRKHTEYVLLGSLLSWSIGIAIGIAVVHITRFQMI